MGSGCVIKKIVSGGQTGADRGGLDAALRLGLPHGGWCPKGRLAEDGTVPSCYSLTECSSKAYVRRTELNVRDSDATVVFTPGKPAGGSAKTIEFAQQYRKPFLHVDSGSAVAVAADTVVNWLRQLREDELIPAAMVLNVAGARGGKNPELRKWTCEVILEVIRRLNGKSQVTAGGRESGSGAV